MQFEPYPFEKLNLLLEGVDVQSNHSLISLTIGEPQLETPQFIVNSLNEHAPLLKKYPATTGVQELRDAMRGFVKRRFDVVLEDKQIIPTFGTREVLFNFPQWLLFDKPNPTMAFCNPFYQIYEGAAKASRAEVVYLDLLPQNNFKPIIDEEVLKHCDLVILNSPNNPTASVLSIDELTVWVDLAVKHDFVLLNDECYSEIYFDSPPASLLQASIQAGNDTFKNIVVVNSISKRSNAPGLRSGFIAGDATLLDSYMKYRTYVGCASPLPLQYAACDAWNNERHVQKSRDMYAKNFEQAQEILGVPLPEATFYIWLEVGDDEAFTRHLYQTQHVKVLPGSYLGRNGIGKGYVRLALVESLEKNERALLRIKEALETFEA